MNLNNVRNNDVNGTGASSEGATSGRCPVEEQRRPDRHPTTARTKWTKELNNLVMKCFYKSTAPHLPKRNYRKRMLNIWNEIGLFELSEQKLAGQARAIKTNKWSLDLELERIKSEVDKDLSPDRNEEAESYIDGRENDSSLAPDFSNSEHESPEVLINEENQHLAIDQNIEGLNDNDLQILNILQEELQKVPLEDPINLRFLGRRKLRNLIAMVNSVIPCLRADSLSDYNNIMKTAANVVARLAGLRVRRKKKEQAEPWWKKRIQLKINQLRKDLSRVEKIKSGELKKGQCWRYFEGKISYSQEGNQLCHRRIEAKNNRQQ